MSEFTHLGLDMRVSIVTDIEDSNGRIVIKGSNGCYYLVYKDTLVKIKTEREKFLDHFGTILTTARCELIYKRLKQAGVDLSPLFEEEK